MPECRMHDQPAATESPDVEAEVAARLHALIADTIDRADGWIPFSRFMELALYAPGLGYYSAGATKVGSDLAGSDFVTAPERTPLFARALARPVAEVLTGAASVVLELGGGSGRLAADLLLALEALGALPERYLLLDVSADFRERQQATVRRDAPHLADRVRWIDTLPDRLDGVVLGNEVLDALPVEVVAWTGSAWEVRGVERSGPRFGFATRPAPYWLARRASTAVGDPSGLPPGYTTEIPAALDALVGTLASRLGDDAIALFIDYGFPASEYYHPQRSTGTLMAHRRHRAHPDVLALPGAQDITSHVDFSAVGRAATAAGATVVGYTSQASFLIDCGIADLLVGDGADVGDTRGWALQAAALQMLLSEAEMGELFKVLVFGRRPRALTGFRRSDRRGAL